MKRKWANISKRMLLAWCLLGGFIFLFTPKTVTGRLQLVYARLFTWPLATGRGIMLASRTPARTHPAAPRDYAKLEAVNRRLRNYVANLESRIKEDQARIEELSKLREVPGWDRMGFLLTNVISVTGEAQNEMFVNRGQADGLAVGQFILGDQSIIGTISNVSAHRAKVMLITDPAAKIPVTIGTAAIPGVMEGHLGNLAKIRFIGAKHKVQTGDLIYVRKDPGRLDVPIVAAEVVQSQRDPDNPVLLDITVRPVCDVANLSTVAVVVGTPRPQ